MPVDRRQFLSVSSLALAGLVVSDTAFPVPLRAVLRSGSRRDEFIPIRGGVGIYRNRGGTMGWLISSDGVAVVDTQFADSAAAFVDGVRVRTDRSIDLVINTHHHGDHTGGNAVLRPHAGQMVAHSHAAGLLAANEGFPADGRPDTTFDAEWSRSFGSETLRARHYGRGAHTGGDAAILFEQANVVHMGDLMFNRMYPVVDGPGGASIRGWVQVLDDVLRDHDSETIYIFGHAAEGFPVTGAADDLRLQRDFLAAALDTAERGIAQGRTVEQMAEQGAPTGFDDHQGPANRLVSLYRVAYADLGHE